VAESGNNWQHPQPDFPIVWCLTDGQPTKSMDHPQLHPVFHIAPSEPPANGAWVAHLGGEPASCRTWFVACRNLSQGGGYLVADFPNILHRLHHWARGLAFTVEVEAGTAKALGVPCRQVFPAAVG
jgi:hypothetical protein